MDKKRVKIILLIVTLSILSLNLVLSQDASNPPNIEDLKADISSLDSDVLVGQESLGYILEFEEKPLIEVYKETDDLAEANEKRIKEMSNFNPIKYGYLIFSTRKGDVAGKVKDHEDKIASEQEAIKEDIKNTLGKRQVSKITGNAILNEEDLNILDEFKNTFNGITVNITPEEADQLRSLEGIKSITPNYQADISTLESIPLIGADSVWDLGLTGEGTKIAIIDTGIDHNHPDMGGCFGPGCKVLGGYDFVNNDASPMDDHGHGTHCAGIAAGDGALKGVAPNADLYAYKVLNSGGSGYWSWIIAGIEAATDPNDDGDFSDKVDVISMSLGGGSSCTSTDALMVSLDNAIAAGSVVVIAAGNNGAPQSISSPGCHEPVITVGATDKSDNMAYFSSRGPAIEDGQQIQKPDLVAPGVNICAAQWDSAWQSNQCYDTEHTAISGTSMATPHVAGVAALLKEADPDVTNQDVKSILQDTAIDLGLHPYDQGSGRLDALAALASYNRTSHVILYTGGQLSGSVDIIGRLFIENFSSYDLEYSSDGTNWNLITSSFNYPKEGIFYTGWDTTELADGNYVLKVTVYSLLGEILTDTNSLLINNYEILSPINDSLYGNEETIEIKGNVPGESLDYYKLEWGKEGIFSSEGITLSNNGQDGVINGTLGTWNLALEDSGYYEVKLIVYQTSGVITEEVATVYLDLEQLPGWPVQLNGEVKFAPVVADLNMDGNKELIIGSGDGKVHVLNSDGTNFPGWPQSVVYSKVFTPAVGDLDADGDLEIVVANYYYIYAWHHDGTLLNGWRKFKYPGQTYKSPTLEDLDNDGDLEIIIGDFEGHVNVWHHNGQDMEGWPLNLTPYIINERLNYQRIAHEIAVGDIDNDNEKELVVWTYKTGQYFVLEPDGSLREGWPQLGDHYGGVGSAIGDVDNDGNLEIVGSGHQVKVWDKDGNLKYPIGSGTGASAERLSIGRIGSNDTLNVVHGWGTKLWLSDIYGNTLPGWPVNFDGNVIELFEHSALITIGDVDGDSSQDLVASSQRGKFGERANLYAFDSSGNLLQGWPKMVGLSPDGIDAVYSTPTINDIDNDGDIEIFVGGKDGKVYAWDLDSLYTPENIDWNGYRHDKRKTSLHSRTGDEQDPLYLVRHLMGERTPYGFSVELETSNPSNITVNVLENGEIALVTYDNTLTYNHTINIGGLNQSTKYTYELLITDEHGQRIRISVTESFYTRTTSKVPALPTSFYGRVETTDGNKVPDVEVTAKWTDVDDNEYGSKTRTLTLQEAEELGDSSLEGYFRFNEGKVKAKKGSQIEVSAPEDLNDPSPSITSNPPYEKEYSSTELPIYLVYNASKLLKEAHYTLNEDSPVNILESQNQLIQLSPKVGENTLTINVKDIASIENSKTIEFTVADVGKPNITIQEPAYSSTTVALSAFVSDELSYLDRCEVCISQNCSWTLANTFSNQYSGSCLYIIQKSAYSDGNHTFNFRVFDVSGNMKEGIEKSFTIDNSVPDQVTNPRIITILGQNILNVSWNPSSDLGFKEYRIYRSSSQEQLIKIISNPYETTFIDTGLESEGSYTYRITVVDNFHNENSGATVTGSVADTIVPEVEITSPIYLKTYLTHNVSLQYTVSEEANCSYNLNGINFPISPIITAWEGLNTLHVICNDGYNIGYSQNITFYVDTLPPATISYINLSQRKSQLIVDLFWYDLPDAERYFLYKSTEDFSSVTGLDPIATLTSPEYSDSGLESQETYYYAVTSEDQWGNKNTNFSTSFIILNEITPPEITITSPQQTTYDNELITLQFEVNEAVKSCEYYLDSNPPIAASSGQYISVNEGIHNIRISCEDLVGNVGYSELVSFNVDIGTPEPISLLTVQKVSGELALRLDWIPSNVSDFKEYRIYRGNNWFNSVEGKTPLATTSSIQYINSGLQQGTYYYAVTAVDIYDNENKNVLSVNATSFDDTPLIVTITSPTQNKKYNTKEIVVEYTANKPIESCDFVLNWESSNDEETITANEGNNTLYLSCIDTSGVVGNSSIVSFTVDTIAPGKITFLNISQIENTNNVQLIWGAYTEDDFLNYNIYRLGSSFNDVSGMTPLVKRTSNDFIDLNLESGTYYYAVTAVDKVLNENKEVDSVYVLVNESDSLLPNVNVLDIGNEVYGTVNLEADVSDNKGLKVSCQVCISSDGTCDTEWVSATSNFGEGSQSGKCSYLWDTDSYNKTSYIYNFRVYDLSDNLGEGTAKLTNVVSPPPLTCSDGTPYNTCSSNKPLYCDNGTLVPDCQVCGCDPGFECNESGTCFAPPAPPNLTCSDGTPYWNCSSNKPFYCENGTLIEDCGFCGCDLGLDCQINGTCAVPPVPPNLTCSDGTPYNTCSSTKPKYCFNGSLIDNCQVCSCNPEEQCDPEGTCSLLPPPSISIDLYEGWNALSIPYGSQETEITTVLSSITGKYNAVFSYDGQSENWLIYRENKTVFDSSNNLASLEPGKGYWIEMLGPATLEIVFEESGTYSKGLVSGWNFIGYPYTTSRETGLALTSLSDKYDIIYSYDNVNKDWTFYSPYPSLIFNNTLNTMEPGKGYWIYLYEDSSWQP